MISEPKTEYRNELHYVAIRSRGKQNEIPQLLPPLIPGLFNWLKLNKISPSGAPFFRYLQMDGENMEVEVGIPVDKQINGFENIQPGSFPAGKYLEVTYTGPYSNLPLVHSELAEWKKKNNMKVKNGVTEFYPTDPDAEPDSRKWKTIIMTQVED